MPNILDIGRPPKGMMLQSGWMDRERPYYKLEVTPCILENTEVLDTVTTFTTGAAPFKVDWKSFAARSALLGCDVPKDTLYDHIYLYALQEGAVNETYTNNISSNTLTGMLAENFMNTGLAKFGRVATQELGVDFGKMAANFVNSYKDTLGLKEEVNADDWSNAWKNAGNTKGREWLQKQLQSALGTSQTATSMSNAASNVFNNLIAMAKGQRPIYPYLWENSTTGSNYTFRIRLYNPNPASQRLHQLYIINPLAQLKALALPSSATTTAKATNENDDGTQNTELSTQSNNCTYGPPLYVKVKCQGLFNIPIGIIENMNVVLGGDENAIAFNGRPSYVDVTISFKPLYQNKVILVDSLQSSPANEFINMETLMDDPNRGQSDNNGQDASNDGGEVTTATGGNANQSDQPVKRVDPVSEEVYDQAKPIETETVPSFLTMPGQ
jgi:hypothetical protein